MKIIHTADLHLGMRPDKGRPWSDERSEALWNALRRIIQTANEEKAALLLIAGDLFHHQPLLRELREVNALFESLAATQVVLIAGNHDCLSPRSHYRDFSWGENVVFLSDSQTESVFFEDLNTEVHGFSYHQTEIREPLYDRLRAPRDGRIHILLGHGGDEKHVPIDINRLAAAGFHYAALGHIHKPDLREDLRLAWCGSPEPVDRTDLGARGYIVADITDRQTLLRFIPCARTSYLPLAVRITPDVTREGLARTLEQTIEKRGSQHIYLITLDGERHPDTDFSQPVPLSGRIGQWTDRTRIFLDYDRLSRLHEGDLLGLFLKEAKQLPPGPLRDKMTAYGVRACLPDK
ncbi:MAG: DNA repair exonuclease [Lachnospiraceae bacterium]|jgi:exonuclease SbcD|nr:DNA repair exonuclease [Lachnospiraceae bacterium]